MPGVDPSEPLHLARLNIHLPNLEFSLLNATMTGVKDCVISFKKNTADTQFEYQPCCPHLTIESQYNVEGKIDVVSFNGKENFYITVIGKQMKVEFGDCKQHIRILNYSTHLDLKGKSTYDYRNLDFGSSGKCKYKLHPDTEQINVLITQRYVLRGNRQRGIDRFEEITRTLITESFVDKFMENVRNFHIAVPVEELYHNYV